MKEVMRLKFTNFPMEYITLGRFLFTLVLCNIYSAAYALENIEEELKHHAFNTERSLTIGIASPQSFDLNSVSINDRIYYNIGETFHFGPEYAFLNQMKSRS